VTAVRQTFIHSTAEVSPDAVVGAGSRIWHAVQIREGARVGSECNIGKNVYIDTGVVIGDRVKIENNVSVFNGVTIEAGVFVGPHVCFCNDLVPRAITPEGALKGPEDWSVGPVLVRYGASIGAGSVILPHVTIGTFALIGAGSVVTRSVPDQALAYGNPARQHGYVCPCGHRLVDVDVNVERTPVTVTGRCSACKRVSILAAAAPDVSSNAVMHPHAGAAEEDHP
jgi:acetyltransferase-like isoleucine patch superfamily enzyme